jgi:flagellar assembly factor FliW
MEIAGTRFGTIQFDEPRTITLPGGLIGFPQEQSFILLEPPSGGIVAWLQSLTSPEIAFPVVAGIAFGADYPSPDARELGRRAKLTKSPEDHFTVLVVVASQPPLGRIANLLAPIVVNVDTRTGAQLVLDPDVYSAAAPFEPRRTATSSAPPRDTVEQEPVHLSS